MIAHREHVRSPVDVFRLIVGAGIVIVGIGVANVADSALLGLSEDGRTSMESLPDWANDVVGTALASLTIAIVVAALISALVTMRFRRLALLVGAFGLGALLSIALGEVLLHVVDGDVRSAFETGGLLLRYDKGGTVHPGDPIVADIVEAPDERRDIGRTGLGRQQSLGRGEAKGDVGLDALFGQGPDGGEPFRTEGNLDHHVVGQVG